MYKLNFLWQAISKGTTEGKHQRPSKKPEQVDILSNNAFCLGLSSPIQIQNFTNNIT